MLEWHHAKVIDELKKVPDQNTIGLNSFLRLVPIKCSYIQIKDVIEK